MARLVLTGAPEIIVAKRFLRTPERRRMKWVGGSCAATAIVTRFPKGPRADQAVEARDLSFTTARRIVIATVEVGTTTAGLPESGDATAGAPDRAPGNPAPTHLTPPPAEDLRRMVRTLRTASPPCLGEPRVISIEGLTKPGGVVC